MVTIDIHHHFAPGGKDNEGRPWSVGMTMDELDRNGVTAAIGSLPPVDGAEPDDGTNARRWNEWASRLCADHAGRLGLFGAVPLRDMDAALAEVAYAYDVLKVDGIGLPTNDGDVWLSDDRFAPLFEELDRRGSVVFLHPYSTSSCRRLGRAYGGELMSPPWLEFPTNSARTILGFLVRGYPQRFPRIRFIFCHGGGTMVPLLGRIAGFEGWDTVGPERLERTFPGGIHKGFSSFYFDCAQVCAPEMFACLQRIVPSSHLLFGSDFTYFPVGHSVAQLADLHLDEGLHAAVAGGNAAALFPRFGR